MRSELKAKFLQYLNQKKQDEGFTLIELIVVLFMIGILSAIAMPSFLNQSTKAKQAEAKQNISVVNRTQVAYRTEHSSFATEFNALAIGTLIGNTNATSSNYSYIILGGNDTATIVATALDTSLKAYSGGSSRDTRESPDTVILSIMCESNTLGTSAAIAPNVSRNEAPHCDEGYKNLSQ